MAVLWQITELSTRDAAGNYVDDLGVGIEHQLGFALDIFNPGSDEEAVTIAAVTAELWRYRQPRELTSPAVARRVKVDDMTTQLDGENVVVTIPADAMEADQMYQLKIVATDSDDVAWVRTREYRAVA